MILVSATRSVARRRAARLTAAGLLVALASAVAVPTVSPSASADITGDITADTAAGGCHNVSLPVEVIKDGPEATVAGTLCTPSGWGEADHADREVDVLVHGGSYNRSYWDWPVDNARYSYVRRANADGRATFAFDRLGTGKTSRPSSGLVTVHTDAYVLHQIVQWARAGHGTVNLVTHSIGGVVGIEEAATYRDVDSLVVTGMLHGLGVGFQGAAILANFWPSALDPGYGNKTLDLGWVTTRPGVRDSIFYHPETADPEVIAYDEQQKDLTTEATLLSTLVETRLPSLLNSTADVTAPVLVMVGEQDALFCGITLNCTSQQAVHALTKPFYPQAESLTVETIPDTGHNLALHPSSGSSYEMINDWLETH